MKKSSPFWNIFGQSFSVIGVLITIKLITNYVSPNDYGIYTIYFSIVVFLKNLTIQPAIQTILKHFPEFNVDKQGFKKFNQLLRLPGYFFLINFIFFLFMGSLLNNQYLFTISLLIGAFFTDSLRDYFRSIQNASKNFKKMSFLTIIPNYLKGIIGIILYNYFPSSESLLIGFIIANVITIILFGFKDVVSLCYDSKKYIIDTTSLIKFMMPLIPHKISSWFFTYIDKYLILLFLGPSIVGLYTPIYNLIHHVYWLVHETITLNFRPFYYEFIQRKKYSDAFKLFKKQITLAFLIYIFLFIIFISPFKNIIPLILNNEYSTYMNLAPLLCISFSLQMIGYIYETIFYSGNRTFLIFKIQFSSGIILLILSLILTKNFGINGLVSSLIIGNLIFVIISTYFANQINKLDN